MSDGKKWVSQISKMHMGTTSDVSFFASKKLSRARLRLERSNGAPRRPGVTHALGVRRACVLAVSRHLHGRAPRTRRESRLAAIAAAGVAPSCQRPEAQSRARADDRVIHEILKIGGCSAGEA